MTNPDDPAFSDEIKPVPLPGSTGHITLYKEIRSVGLTKREWLAGMALGGMTMMSESAPKLAAWAVEYADALLAQLNKKP